jgi:hypothetical protein
MPDHDPQVMGVIRDGSSSIQGSLPLSDHHTIQATGCAQFIAKRKQSTYQQE